MTDPSLPEFSPPNPAYAEACRDSFARQGFMTLLGAELTRIAPGFCEIGCKVRRELTQQHHYVHGGVLASLADSAAGYAAFSLMPPDSAPLTVEYKLNILRPGDGDMLFARGRVLKPGRTLHVVQADVFVRKDGVEVQAVASLQTLICLAGKNDNPSGAQPPRR